MMTSDEAAKRCATSKGAAGRKFRPSTLVYDFAELMWRRIELLVFNDFPMSISVFSISRELRFTAVAALILLGCGGAPLLSQNQPSLPTQPAPMHDPTRP